ncbi:hypothetical protein A2U01_0091213, partial [Trifolium medium]|nr:hypothetical protein [Trifolium medium]
RASPSCASRRLQKQNCLRTKIMCVAPALAARRARVRNQTAFISKNAASRQMLLRAASKAENGEIVAVCS